jgi:hypothetical protein
VHVSGTLQTARDLGNALPAAVPGADGGVMIAGSNAAATFASLSITGQLDAGNVLVDGTAVLTGAITLGAVSGTTLALSGAVTAASVTLSGTLQAATIVSTGTTTLNALTVTAALTAGTNALPWNAAWDAEVESEVNDALVVLKLDHLVAVADADDVVNDSIIAKMVSKGATADWSGFVNTTDSLEAIRDAMALEATLTAGTLTLAAAYDPAKTAAQAGDAMALTVAERAAVSDKLLGRSLATGADGGRTVQDALRALRNKSAIGAGVLTVFQENDLTAAWTATVTTAASDPIDSVDPA